MGGGRKEEGRKEGGEKGRRGERKEGERKKMRPRSENTPFPLFSPLPFPSLTSFPSPIPSPPSPFPSSSKFPLSRSSALNTSDEPRSLVVERTRKWCAETDHKLSILAHKVAASLVMSEGWRVRVGMVVWAHSLLTHCHR